MQILNPYAMPKRTQTGVYKKYWLHQNQMTINILIYLFL